MANVSANSKSKSTGGNDPDKKLSYWGLGQWKSDSERLSEATPYRSGLGTIASVGGDLLASLGSSAALKQQAANIMTGAANTRKQADADFRTSLDNEHVARRNMNATMSQARGIQAASGFTNEGTANVGEVEVARGYEHNIAQEEARRENARRSAYYQADLGDWQAKQAKKQAKGGLLKSALSAAATIGGAALGGVPGAMLGSQLGGVGGQLFGNMK